MDDLIAEIEQVRGVSGAKEERLVARIRGQEQLWLAACEQAVDQGRLDWLLRFAELSSTELPWPLDLLEEQVTGSSLPARLVLQLQMCYSTPSR